MATLFCITHIYKRPKRYKTSTVHECYYKYTRLHANIYNDINYYCTHTCTKLFARRKNIQSLWRHHSTHHCTRTRLNNRKNIKLTFNHIQPISRNLETPLYTIFISKHPATTKRPSAHGHMHQLCHRSINTLHKRFSWTYPIQFWLPQTPPLEIVLQTIYIIIEASAMEIFNWASPTYARLQTEHTRKPTCNLQTNTWHSICFLAC